MTARTMRTLADLILGTSPGEIATALQGALTNLPNATTSVIEEQTITPNLIAAGEALTVVSSNAADVGEVVSLSLLGANWTRLAPILVTLNGTTPVAVPGGPFTRVNGVSRISGDNAGTVTVNGLASAVRGFLAAGQQNQRSTRYTVPAGFRFFVTDLISSLTRDAGANSACAFSLQGRPVGSTGFGSLLNWNLQRDGTNCAHFSQQVATPIVGPFDLRIVGTPNVASMDVQAYLAGILQDLSV